MKLFRATISMCDSGTPNEPPEREWNEFIPILASSLEIAQEIARRETKKKMPAQLIELAQIEIEEKVGTDTLSKLISSFTCVLIEISEEDQKTVGLGYIRKYPW